MTCIGTITEGFHYDNPYTHHRYGVDVYRCSVCNEVQHSEYDIIEDHDMNWNDDMTALVCECGFEDKW